MTRRPRRLYATRNQLPLPGFNEEAIIVAEWEIVRQAVQSSLNIEPDAWAAFEGCRLVEAYTDGSAPIRNPGGPAGFAAIVVGYPDSVGQEMLGDTTPYARHEMGRYVP